MTGEGTAATPPASSGPRSAVVVLCQLPMAVAIIQARCPSVEVVDISQGVPPGLRGEVLFGGRGRHAAEAMAAGVRWVQMAGTCSR